MELDGNGRKLRRSREEKSSSLIFVRSFFCVFNVSPRRRISLQPLTLSVQKRKLKSWKVVHVSYVQIIQHDQKKF